MKKIIILIISILSLSALFLIACGNDTSGDKGDGANEEVSLKKVDVIVGRQAWAAGNVPITQYMIENNLFEKHAEKYGYDLRVDYQDHPSAAPMVEQMVAGRLDFGMWGNTPIIRNIASNQDLSVLNVGEGHLRYVLVTREGNGIRNLEDLEGKTVGLLVGGDPHNAFNQMLRYHLDISDPEEMNIKLVNISSFSQAASVPKGVDATVTYLPALLKALEEDPEIKPLVNAFGYTEEYWDDGELSGEGHLLDSVKESPFYPDGYYLHRSMWVVRNSFIEEHPDIATAFVLAQQEALNDLKKMSHEEIAKLVEEYWELSPELASQIIEDEILFIRGWVWPTEGDAVSMLETSKFMADAGLIDNELTWNDIKNNLERTSAILEKAYDELDQYPTESEFTSTETDVRGLPTWNMEEWEEPQE